jgi:hypothetical protein
MAYHILSDFGDRDSKNAFDGGIGWSLLKCEDGPGHESVKFSDNGPGWQLFDGGAGWKCDVGERGNGLFTEGGKGWSLTEGGTGWSLLNHGEGEEALSLDDGERGQKFYGPPEGSGYLVEQPRFLR